jgi:hypothetical protein
MTLKKTTVLMAAVIAVATVLAAGLTVLPSSVQEAQANPCSNVATGEVNGGEGNAEGDSTAAGGDITTSDQECSFIGPVDIDED